MDGEQLVKLNSDKSAIDFDCQEGTLCARAVQIDFAVDMEARRRILACGLPSQQNQRDVGRRTCYLKGWEVVRSRRVGTDGTSGWEGRACLSGLHEAGRCKG